MAKIDFKKQLSDLYAPGKKAIQIVDVPALNFIMIDGKGSPDDSAYAEAIQVLYAISYTLKFMIKKSGTDYAVMPLEGLWWSDNMADFMEHNKSNWQWNALIMQPEFVTEQLFRSAVDQVKASKNPPGLSKVRFESFNEGLCAQIMYLGPYSEEGPTIQKIHQFILENGYTLSGKHHEIYMSDPRRTAPEKLKTIIRQPMQKVIKTAVLRQ